MKKLLAVTALIAVIASPALAKSPAVGVYIGPHYLGPQGTDANWNNINTGEYGGSRLVNVPYSTHQKPYGLW